MATEMVKYLQKSSSKVSLSLLYSSATRGNDSALKADSCSKRGELKLNMVTVRRNLRFQFPLARENTRA
jgi:hypothetical protein